MGSATPMASSIQAVMAQRLIRVLCPKCKEPDPNPDPKFLRLVGITPEDRARGNICKAIGCENCSGTGYRGRKAIFELLDFSDELRDVILKEPTIAAMNGHATAGGLILVLACDYRLGVEGDYRIGLNEVAIGLTLPKFAAGLAADRLLPTAVAAATMGAQVHDVAGAQAVGYLDHVVPAEDLLATAVEEARRLGQLDTAAYAGTKANLRAELIERELARVVEDMESLELPSI